MKIAIKQKTINSEQHCFQKLPNVKILKSNYKTTMSVISGLLQSIFFQNVELIL